MESVAPTHQLLMAVKFGIEKNEPIRQVLQRFMTHSDRDLCELCRHHLSTFNKSAATELSLPSTIGLNVHRSFNDGSIYRQQLFVLIQRGLEGNPIYTQLEQLEIEIEDACLQQIDGFAKKAPLYGLIPILLFIFPAYAILMFYPLLQMVFRNLQ